MIPRKGETLNEMIQQISVLLVPILMAVTFHELAHGWAAYRLGDPTAKMAGRLTLNPLKHLDVLGTIVFFVTRMIGWAKPVPVNPFNFKNPKRDMAWVALAGPAMNLLLAAGLPSC
jgi:Zn-dependent protease